MSAKAASTLIPPFVGKFKAVLIFGPPGAGKGTQGQYMNMSDAIVHVSTGDIFRSLSPQSPAGKLFHSYADKGLLVPDDVTIEIFRYYTDGLIATNKFFPERQTLLLDGVPRTLEQAIMMDQYIDVQSIVLLEVPCKETLIARLQSRAKKEGRIDDADINVLQKRMEVFEKQTKAVGSHYNPALVKRINSDQRPLHVFADIVKAIPELL